MRGDSIRCGGCARWMRRGCGGIEGRLRPDPDFQCEVCSSGVRDLPVVDHREIDVDGDGGLEMVPRFCYLGDVIGAGGGSEEAVG